ncbi:MAG: 3-deoxy-7-phosphoheptulonate synthase, partial [Pedobacter sp.]
FEKSAFRNEPMWELAIQLKTLCPELPIINDPSHICGNRELIPYISQKALDLDMQGLMIESHIDPSVAWTDAKQQVTPAALEEMVSRFSLRKPESKNEEFADKLADLRKQIDKIDDLVIQKLAERMSITQKIGEFKRDNKVTILQVNRWDEIMQKRTAFAKALQLDVNFTEKFLELVHGESIRRQTEIMNAGKAEKGIAAEAHAEVK